MPPARSDDRHWNVPQPGGLIERAHLVQVVARLLLRFNVEHDSWLHKRIGGAVHCNNLQEERDCATRNNKLHAVPAADEFLPKFWSVEIIRVFLRGTPEEIPFGVHSPTACSGANFTQSSKVHMYRGLGRWEQLRGAGRALYFSLLAGH